MLPRKALVYRSCKYTHDVWRGMWKPLEIHGGLWCTWLLQYSALWQTSALNYAEELKLSWTQKSIQTGMNQFGQFWNIEIWCLLRALSVNSSYVNCYLKLLIYSNLKRYRPVNAVYRQDLVLLHPNFKVSVHSAFFQMFQLRRSWSLTASDGLHHGS